jgi:hypothetical protein
MKRAIVATVTAATVFGGVYGFAATANVGSAAMGAGGAVVQSCQSEEIKVSYATAWDAVVRAHRVSSVTISGIKESCNGHALGVALTGTSGEATTSLYDATGSTGTTGTVVISTAEAGPRAAAVTGVQVVVSK